ncbi:MmcQ/YjbR family DNA-binding protein [Jiangella gansuensis]|uniref:MmcQ/YjbR family DNA-binding protein n=1 Tax=Jiangella gansuensis TaxID=281473 RepID=UPI00047C5772|nr:MmcQ/YjbR family DNA-binding protein [Jiangella gansuensis]
MAVPDTAFLRILDRLPEVRHTESRNYTAFAVRGKTFGYLWPDTQTVGLKQTISEQLALVAERPHVFEVQFTAGGFGWVVVQLAGIDHDELTELTFEAWRLTAPPALIEEFGDQPPR